jgi:hypothetical protein
MPAIGSQSPLLREHASTVRPFERIRKRGGPKAPTEGVFPTHHRELLNAVLIGTGLKFDREGNPRRAYSLGHLYVPAPYTECRARDLQPPLFLAAADRRFGPGDYPLSISDSRMSGDRTCCAPLTDSFMPQHSRRR